MTTVNRQEFLSKLESVEPGLSPRPILEQSSSFVFKDGKVMTYNEEIACRYKTPLKITGAVHAAHLLTLLRKLGEEEVEVDVNEEQTEILIKGKGRRAGIALDANIVLGIDAVEEPGEWADLPEDFLEGISMVGECAARDASNFPLNCINIAPKWLEAADDFQIMRYKIKTGVQDATLVKQEYIRHITKLEMNQVSLTETWIHFRNKGGLIFSCRRYVDEYKDLTPYLEVEGEQVTLPPGLGDETERAEIFAAERDNLLEITLKIGRVVVKGTGINGWYRADRKLQNFKGEPINFFVTPHTLRDLMKKGKECEASADKLRIQGGKFTYVACLTNPEGPQGNEEPVVEEQEGQEE